MEPPVTRAGREQKAPPPEQKWGDDQNPRCEDDADYQGRKASPGQTENLASPLVFSDRSQELLVEFQRIIEEFRLDFQPTVTDRAGMPDQNRRDECSEKRHADRDR